MNITTTQVGSWPRTQVLQKARMQLEQGTITAEEFEHLLNREVSSIVKVQIETGVDEITDGEFRRSIYFGEITGLPGFHQNAFPVEFSAGDIYWTAVVEKKLEYNPTTSFIAREVKMLKDTLHELKVEKRVKVTLPSPSHMAAFYPDPTTPGLPASAVDKIKEIHDRVVQDYPTVTDFVADLRAILLNEAKSAITAGADTIQFDSPDILAFTSPEMPLDVLKAITRQRVEMNNLVLAELPPEKLQIHACWGNYIGTQVATLGSISNLLPELYDLKVGTLGPLEVFDGTRDFDELNKLKAYPLPERLNLALGIVSVKTRNVEPVEVLRKRYKAALHVVGDDPERLIVSPGCGFASESTTVISLESARRKLTNLVKAVQAEIAD